MSGQPLENGLINLREYEIVHEPTPRDETPRQMLLRVTGRDLSNLAFDGRDFTWQEVKDAGALPLIEHILQVCSLPPRILLKKK